MSTRFSERPRLGVLISGRGSNLQAIIGAIATNELHASVAIIISNVAGAPGLQRADAARIPTLVLPHHDWRTRDDYDRALADTLHEHDVELVCLAGFMRRLGPSFIDAFPDRILNIHPSLLPAFPGLDAQRQAFEHGVRITGATVHFVTAQLDSGPIVLQAAVEVRPTDTVESLSERILAEEHRLYPRAIRLVLDGGWQLVGRRFVNGNTP